MQIAAAAAPPLSELPPDRAHALVGHQRAQERRRYCRRGAAMELARLVGDRLGHPCRDAQPWRTRDVGFHAPSRRRMTVLPFPAALIAPAILSAASRSGSSARCA